MLKITIPTFPQPLWKSVWVLLWITTSFCGNVNNSLNKLILEIKFIFTVLIRNKIKGVDNSVRLFVVFMCMSCGQSCG